MHHSSTFGRVNRAALMSVGRARQWSSSDWWTDGAITRVSVWLMWAGPALYSVLPKRPHFSIKAVASFLIGRGRREKMGDENWGEEKGKRKQGGGTGTVREVQLALRSLPDQPYTTPCSRRETHTSTHRKENTHNTYMPTDKVSSCQITIGESFDCVQYIFSTLLLFL